MTIIQRPLLASALQAGLFVFLGLGGRTAWSAPATQEAFALHSFERHHLSDVYFAEGVAVGDIDGDGVQDVTSGPLWFKGPGFELGGEIRPAVPQDRARYTDHFFSWVYDVNADGHADVLAVGFPGTPGHVYVNPGPDHLDQHWKKHAILNSVANESPQFIQLVGDGTPELVCTNGGAFGYATINPKTPLEAWTFHPISDVVAPKQFGHGLGVGDVDGDGRQDVLSKSGWYAQPADLTGDPKWAFHPVNFAQPGGAEIYAYDVDGDGDSDVITSLSAHEFGLAWHEQIQEDGEIRFTKHLIMGAKAEENPYGLHFSELHSVALADMDGDGLKDIVTGKTYYSHHEQSTDWDAGAVVYWFGLQRSAAGSVSWVPHLADGDAGIGRQIVVSDINADGKPDIAVGGMKGCSVLLHETVATDAAGWRAAQPRRRKTD
ncbi:MAG TPA: VCBS repeat-containing protein [Planctomycetota bacterium]|jgi:hypothetical protein|nr:VCBS repeat-containing protein [Planctomycetota bacterium]